MGLCKCRVVTTLFCFQHRINVCENCLVDKHKACVVQTYLQWLQDSDFDPTCRLCSGLLDDQSETIRLPCLHVVHLSCLDKYAAKFPANTAPAGYTCPICKAGVVPQASAGGPVAIAARKQLMAKSWSGLTRRLPSSGGSTGGSDAHAPGALAGRKGSGGGGNTNSTVGGAQNAYHTNGDGGAVMPHASDSNGGVPAPPEGKINGTTGMITIPAEMGSGFASGGTTTFNDSNASALGHTVVKMPAVIDADDDKYAKKPNTDRQSRFSHTVSSPSAGLRRMAIGFLAFVVLAITLIELMTRSRNGGHTSEPL